MQNTFVKKKKKHTKKTPLSETLVTGHPLWTQRRSCRLSRAGLCACALLSAVKISRFVSDSLGGLGASVERSYWAQVFCPFHF